MRLLSYLTSRPKQSPDGQVGGTTAQANATTPATVAPSASYRSKTEEGLRNLFRNPVGLALMSLVIFFVLAYPFLDEFLEFRKITSVVPIIMYILLALGLNVVVGYAGLLDLGYAAFFAIGAYAAAFVTSPRSPFFGDLQWFGLDSFWFAIIVAFFIAIIAGMALGAPTLRLRGDYLAIVTLGFGEIVPVVFRNAEAWTNGEKGMGGIAKPEVDLFGATFSIGGEPIGTLGQWSAQLPWYYLLLVMGGLAVVGLRRMQDSRVGRAWMAMREDEISSSAMGINLVTTKLSAFGMGASLSGVVGAVYGAYVGLVHPSAFEFSTSVILLCAVILGGLGNIWGVILGGFIIQFFDRILSIEMTGWLQGLGRSTGNEFLSTLELSNFRFFLFGLALVLMMLIRPEGMVPSARRRAELHPENDTPQLDDDAPPGGTTEPGAEPTPASVQTRQPLYDVRERGESTQETR